ncbi:rhamnan synthesis F family protein [Methylocystis sp. JAN1]|uniref:rhamnan synthesis F family protein n=1 Tax=Methylocystis sp. JAN1 TaxID=3397211 RepID=UPI003FA2C5BF
MSGYEARNRRGDIAVLLKNTLKTRVEQWSRKASHKRIQKIIESSGLFDADWYLTRYQDVAQGKIDALTHYLEHGAEEGRWASPLFHTDWYLRSNPDVVANKINPLLHFVLHGAYENRDPNPFFSTRLYQEANQTGRENPLSHFCRVGHFSANPSDKFDTAWYRSRYLAHEPDEVNALAHYFRCGRDRHFFPHPNEEERYFRQRRVIERSGLFDPGFYRQVYPDVRASDLDPLEHFMFHGAREGRKPHFLFDVGWYLRQAVADEDAHANPLLHYLETGAARGLNPNAWFDGLWYLNAYEDCRESGLSPLAHFLIHGGRKTSPSRYFDAIWYWRRHPDVAAARTNPLKHYLETGLAEGRQTRTIRSALVPSDLPSSAKITCLKNQRASGRAAALFVTHAPSGAVKGHVEHYVRAFAGQDVDVVLIIAADQRKTSVPTSLADACANIYVRQNIGFDFAAWAHVLELDPGLYDCPVLYLVNDSLIGPIEEGQFNRLLGRVATAREDIVGLTENAVYARHLQSYFLALKKQALTSYALHLFFQEIVNFSDKELVIRNYEVSFTARMRGAGLVCESFFGGYAETQEDSNATIFSWHELCDSGFPFIKASLVEGEHREKGGVAVEKFLRSRKFDLALLDPNRSRSGPKLWADLNHPGSTSNGKPRVSMIGPWNFANGLGHASRGYVSALLQGNFACNFSAIERPFHVHARTAPSWSAQSFSGASDVALVHVNGEAWDALLSPGQFEIIDRAKLLIGLFVWELSALPREWLKTINRLDAIWAPSEFCAEIFRNYTDVPVQVVPYVVEKTTRSPDPAAVTKLRKKLGLSSSKRIILYAFDGSSFLARKNPHALVRAFRASGLARDGWRLLLKTKHVFDIPSEGGKLMELVGSDSAITVIDRPLSRPELQQLFAIADIYASSHCSEGFGLTIAEAMAMGKVVVATDFGGSRDFLDANCGFPVAADVSVLDRDFGPYARGGAWATVDEAALARALKDAARAVRGGSDIGDRARARIASQLSAPAVAAIMEKNINELLSRDRPKVSEDAQ